MEGIDARRVLTMKNMNLHEKRQNDGYPQMTQMKGMIGYWNDGVMFSRHAAKTAKSCKSAGMVFP